MSPALAGANNGNWRTASRWRRMLRAAFAVRIVEEWPDGPAAESDHAMIALHAQRSAASIEAWARARPKGALAVVLTGTDLYGRHDATTLASLERAGRLVVLQELGAAALPRRHRARATVIFQSTSRRARVAKPAGHLRALMVGHLRAVKSPQSMFEAARLLRDEPRILLDHVGGALEARLGAQASRTAARYPAYRWLGEASAEDTRRRIQRAHVLVHASRVEGGAHVIMEAVRSGTPVLASRIDGNVGMLGADYRGYFPHGDAAALARLLVRCRDDPRFLAALRSQCARREPLFAPEAERAALMRLARQLLR